MRAEKITSVLVGLAAALAVFAILWPALFLNRTQSFDVMLYSRGLWGLSHFDGYNPVAGTATLAVHFHFGLLILAPFARVLNPLTLLIASQALAFGLVVAMTVNAGMSVLKPSRFLIGWAGGLALLIVSSCWVSNAFLFDVRPDLLAVPLALGGFLRLARDGRVNGVTALLCLSSVLMREEMALTVAAASLAAPGVRKDPRMRMILALLALGWWSFYILWGRTLLGGDIAVERLGGSVETLLGTSLAKWPSLFQTIMINRLQVLIAAGLTLGGAALFGGRWWIAAAPGLAWVTVSLRAPEEALHYHYTMFAAPALLTAGVVGLRRVREAWESAPTPVSRRTILIIASILVLASIGIATKWSSWPGGGKFAETRYKASKGPQGPALTRAHYLLDTAISPDEGAAIPWSLVGGRAGRSFIWTHSQLAEAIQAGKDLPSQLVVVALIRGDAYRFEKPLTARYGFQRMTSDQEPLQIYRRSASH